MKKRTSRIKNTNPRSTCPIAGTLDLVGDKWTLLIIRDLIKGKTKYGEFSKSAEGIPTNILAARLKSLESEGLIEKRAYSKRPPRFEYFLTDSGSRFEGLILFLRDWGSQNVRSEK